ncbi:MAG: pentapeptide repeat-containing protein [Roseiflexaceae bacterium]
MLLIVAAVMALGYLLYAGFTYGWPAWTGFGPYTPPQPPIEGYQREKTLWDWLQLLIIPIVLVVGGFFLNRTERINGEKIAERRAATEREIADRRAQDTVLDTYLDRMAELLVDTQLLKSQPDDEVRDIARTRTLTALRRLDGERNQILIRFLRDARLLGRQPGPGISIIDMRQANLRGINLRGVNLRGANLQSVNLQEADLQNTNLQEANLQGANLAGTNLQGSSLLETNLRGADLRGADLREATLWEADLREADLREANLHGAGLHGAKLHSANLRGAKLQDDSLQGASLQGATMPDGSKH